MSQPTLNENLVSKLDVPDGVELWGVQSLGDVEMP